RIDAGAASRGPGAVRAGRPGYRRGAAGLRFTPAPELLQARSGQPGVSAGSPAVLEGGPGSPGAGKPAGLARRSPHEDQAESGQASGRFRSGTRIRRGVAGAPTGRHTDPHGHGRSSGSARVDPAGGLAAGTGVATGSAHAAAEPAAGALVRETGEL